RERPVAVNGELSVKPIMTASLSFDHRIVDGAPAAAFLSRVKALLEMPNLLML
ncbi:MAG TPA: 2-oxo acid dehydrogenase subunit E2, partial [Bacillales bacterium]|nr:2-oxo acid dehydrogenase subunit E2 [Bacillales bacterium]